jgi:D-sedoheptulose 7-phosphate isomerase
MGPVDVRAQDLDATPVQSYLAETADLLRETTDACAGDIEEAAGLLISCLRAGGKLLICGNGGSAADAQHLATEFASTLTLDNPRPAIPAIALTTDTSLLTAIANDFGVDGMFSRQVEALGGEGDVLCCISTSGNSPNVVQAAEQARELGLRVVGLTGSGGGKLAAVSDVTIRVPSFVTAHVQECHLAIEHLIALLVERALYPA